MALFFVIEVKSWRKNVSITYILVVPTLQDTNCLCVISMIIELYIKIQL